MEPETILGAMSYVRSIQAASIPRSARIVAVFALSCGSLGFASGCQVEGTELDPIATPGACACEDGGAAAVCPATHCGVRIEVDQATCAGKVDKVEVIIGDTLEAHIWKVGAPKVTCRGIPVNGKAIVYARADTPWKWQSEPLTCTEALAGSTIEHVLECTTR